MIPSPKTFRFRTGGTYMSHAGADYLTCGRPMSQSENSSKPTPSYGTTCITQTRPGTRTPLNNQTPGAPMSQSGTSRVHGHRPACHRERVSSSTTFIIVPQRVTECEYDAKLAPHRMIGWASRVSTVFATATVEITMNLQGGPGSPRDRGREESRCNFSDTTWRVP